VGAEFHVTENSFQLDVIRCKTDSFAPFIGGGFSDCAFGFAHRDIVALVTTAFVGILLKSKRNTPLALQFGEHIQEIAA
jgi:hypothetical protein